MRWYDQHILPWLIDIACGLPMVQGRRAALVLGLYPLMRRAQEKPRYMGYVLAAMLVVSGAFVVFVEAYGFSADTDAENLASGIGNAWKMLGAVAGMTLAL